MTKERLEEIKNSITIQLQGEHAVGNDKPSSTLQRTIDLYNYVIELQEVLEEIREYCKLNEDSLYTHDVDYDYEENAVDDYTLSNFREDILEIIEKVSDK